jgi:hypothetical protein
MQGEQGILSMIDFGLHLVISEVHFGGSGFREGSGLPAEQPDIVARLRIVLERASYCKDKFLPANDREAKDWFQVDRHHQFP